MNKIPDFFSWEGIIALSILLMCCSAFIDWLLKKNHKDALLLKIGLIGETISHAPIREWKLKITSLLLTFWNKLNNAPNNLIILILRRDTENNLSFFWILILLFLNPLMFSLYILNDIPLTWMEALISLSFIPYGLNFSLGALCVLVLAIYFNNFKVSQSKLSQEQYYKNLEKLPTSTFFTLLIKTSPTFLISILFTISALYVSIYLSNNSNSNYWITCLNNDVVINKPILLSLINFPIDFLTVFISIKILRWYQKHKKYFVTLAFLDIIISALLVFLQFSILYLVDVYIMTFSFSTLFDNNIIHQFYIEISHITSLTPILLTSFIPVFVYMTSFIFIGLILKPLFKFFGHICTQFFEKLDSPLLIISFVISSLMTLCKALSEWKWFIYLIDNL